MGWAARANPVTAEDWKTRRLRRLCKLMPRDVVEKATLKMSDSDREITLLMLDELKPREKFDA